MSARRKPQRRKKTPKAATAQDVTAPESGATVQASSDQEQGAVALPDELVVVLDDQVEAVEEPATEAQPVETQASADEAVDLPVADDSQADEDQEGDDAKPEKTAKKGRQPKKVGAAPRDNPFKNFVAIVKDRWPTSVILASNMPRFETPRISTGNFGLDRATYGGYPRGRIIRPFGAPRSTKTGSCLNTIVEWQKHCCFCFAREACSCKDRAPAGALWVDAEGKLADDHMRPWMEGHGVKFDALALERPDSGEEIIDVVDTGLRKGVGLIVVDSVAHMVTKEEILKPAEDGDLPGRGAKLINKAMRRWVVALTQRGFEDANRVPTIIIINQVRGTFDRYVLETLPGGKGQEFATSLDIRFHSTKSRRRYRVMKSGGKFTDLKEPPDGDTPADYVQADFRVTSSSVSDAGCYGSYNYWLRNVHGRRKGDPDNAAQLAIYLTRYECLRETKDGWGIVFPAAWGGDKAPLLVADKKIDLLEKFRKDEVVQHQVWTRFIAKLCAS